MKTFGVICALAPAAALADPATDETIVVIDAAAPDRDRALTDAR